MKRPMRLSFTDLHRPPLYALRVSGTREWAVLSAKVSDWGRRTRLRRGGKLSRDLFGRRSPLAEYLMMAWGKVGTKRRSTIQEAYWWEVSPRMRLFYRDARPDPAARPGWARGLLAAALRREVTHHAGYGASPGPRDESCGDCPATSGPRGLEGPLRRMHLRCPPPPRRPVPAQAVEGGAVRPDVFVRWARREVLVNQYKLTREDQKCDHGLAFGTTCDLCALAGKRYPWEKAPWWWGPVRSSTLPGFPILPPALAARLLHRRAWCGSGR